MEQMKKEKKRATFWSDVKAILGRIDKPDLIDLVADLYHSSKDNQRFLHARYAIGDDVLAPYKKIVRASMYPDILGETGDVDIERARRAVCDYAKAACDPEGEAELLTCLVEWGHRFTLDYGDIDEGFYDALVEVFTEAAKKVSAMPGEKQTAFQKRLRKIVRTSDGIGWGYHDGLCEACYEAFGEE